MQSLLRSVAPLIVLTCFTTETLAADWTVEKSDRGVTVKLDGKLVTEYLVKSKTKPILWPIIGPSGNPLTRAYPMEKLEGEEHDHPHHRSLWFTHGLVNGVDFWLEEGKPHGTIEHRTFEEVKGGDRATIVTRNDWLAPDGRKLLEDERRIVFSEDAGRRIIDFDITLKATDGPVVFGDTKEGSFGVRVASTARVDAKKGGKIVNEQGLTDADAWESPQPGSTTMGRLPGRPRALPSSIIPPASAIPRSGTSARTDCMPPIRSGFMISQAKAMARSRCLPANR